MLFVKPDHLGNKRRCLSSSQYLYFSMQVVKKYMVTGKQADAEEYKTGRHFSPELCFLSLIYGQFVFQLVYIAILTCNSDNTMSGCLGIILGKLLMESVP